MHQPDEQALKGGKTQGRRRFQPAAALGYDTNTFFQTFGERLVALAGLRPGTRVLDVACRGRGAVLFPAAARWNPGSRRQRRLRRGHGRGHSRRV